MKSIKTIAGIALLALSIPVAARAQETEIASPVEDEAAIVETIDRGAVKGVGRSVKPSVAYFAVGPANRYLCTLGDTLNENPVIQGVVGFDIAKNLVQSGDAVSAFVWGNYGINGPHEIDWGVSYAFKPVALGDADASGVSLVKGVVSGDVGYSQWHYPDGKLASQADKVLAVNLGYSMRLFDAGVLYYQRLNDSLGAQHLARLQLSKPVQAGNGLVVVPSISGVWASDFYSRNGYIGTNTGVAVKRQVSDNVSLEGKLIRFWPATSSGSDHIQAGFTVSVTVPQK